MKGIFCAWHRRTICCTSSAVPGKTTQPGFAFKRASPSDSYVDNSSGSRRMPAGPTMRSRPWMKSTFNIGLSGIVAWRFRYPFSAASRRSASLSACSAFLISRSRFSLSFRAFSSSFRAFASAALRRASSNLSRFKSSRLGPAGAGVGFSFAFSAFDVDGAWLYAGEQAETDGRRFAGEAARRSSVGNAARVRRTASRTASVSDAPRFSAIATALAYAFSSVVR